MSCYWMGLIAALALPTGLAGQADSTPADSALTQPAGLGSRTVVRSTAERTTAFYAFYDALFGQRRFYGGGRSVRLGVEIRW